MSTRFHHVRKLTTATGTVPKTKVQQKPKRTHGRAAHQQRKFPVRTHATHSDSLATPTAVEARASPVGGLGVQDQQDLQDQQDQQQQQQQQEEEEEQQQQQQQQG